MGALSRFCSPTRTGNPAVRGGAQQCRHPLYLLFQADGARDQRYPAHACALALALTPSPALTQIRTTPARAPVKEYANRIGLETDWNCCISLTADGADPNDTQDKAQMPRGIENVRFGGPFLTCLENTRSPVFLSDSLVLV